MTDGHDHGDLLRRAVNALEMIAIHQKRVADMMETQYQSHTQIEASLKTLLGDAVEGTENNEPSAFHPVEAASDPPQPRNEAVWDGDPHNWFISNHDGPNPVIMVRLVDGSSRPATKEERRRLK